LSAAAMLICGSCSELTLVGVLSMGKRHGE
jgi:hypothetical protein